MIKQTNTIFLEKKSMSLQRNKQNNASKCRILSDVCVFETTVDRLCVSI